MTDDWLTNTHPALRRSWLPAARSAEVTADPSRVWLLGDPYVAVRAGSEVVVLPDRCPHRFAPLSAGTLTGTELVCAYHGWRFGPDGRCRHIPSLGAGATLPRRADLTGPWGVQERYGMVFVALDEPLTPLLDSLDWDDPDRCRVDMEPVEGPYSAALLMDNQIDATHFAFIHRGTFGAEQAEKVPAYTVEKTAWGFDTVIPIPVTAANDPLALAGERPMIQHRSMEYRYVAPFQMELRLDYPEMGSSNTILFWMQPQKPDAARMYVTLLLRQTGGFSADQLEARVKFEERVVTEDLWLQARFDRLGMPMDVSAECHVKSDAGSVEYRRILRRLVEASQSRPA